jgi:hypothetical protein
MAESGDELVTVLLSLLYSRVRRGLSYLYATPILTDRWTQFTISKCSPHRLKELFLIPAQCLRWWLPCVALSSQYTEVNGRLLDSRIFPAIRR